MIIVVELLLITVLFMIMVTVGIDEINHKKRSRHFVRLNEYWSGTERRVVKRYDTMLDVNYQLDRNPKNSTSRDISAHGICLLLEEKLEKDTPLSLEIKTDNPKNPIKVKGRIAWCKEVIEEAKYSPKRLFKTGIKFTNFSDTSQERRLFSYINSIEKHPSA